MFLFAATAQHTPEASVQKAAAGKTIEVFVNVARQTMAVRISGNEVLTQALDLGANKAIEQRGLGLPAAILGALYARLK